jgi:SAM-dependent methyltransferase
LQAFFCFLEGCVNYRRCEVCRAEASDLFLLTPRLDGPLVRCPECGFLYVGARGRDFTFAAADPDRTRQLGELVDELQIVDRGLEESADVRAQIGERERERVEQLLRFAPAGGTLLDVGASNGAFLAAARGHFAVRGVEPDPGTAAEARALGLEVVTGTLEELSPVPTYDAITMFHVIEHLDSPRAALMQVRSLLKPGGVLLIETPSADNLWFALAPGRWRQLIPDHYFFFSPATLTRLLQELGMRPRAQQTVARRVSLGFAADRLRRAGLPGAGAAARVLAATHQSRRRVRLDPGDIIQVVAEVPCESRQKRNP